MSDYALPCIVCGKQLRNIYQNVDNQPYDGIAIQTTGNYGSTVWDSFDGQFLEFNICDDCLIRAAEQDRVWVAREKRRVPTEDGDGWEWTHATYLPLPWRPGMPSDDPCTTEEENSQPEGWQANMIRHTFDAGITTADGKTHWAQEAWDDAEEALAYGLEWAATRIRDKESRARKVLVAHTVTDDDTGSTIATNDQYMVTVIGQD